MYNIVIDQKENVMKKRVLTAIVLFLALPLFLSGQEREVQRGEYQRGDFQRGQFQRGMGGMRAPKFVFYFIGDGMGLAQVSLAEAYLGSLKGEISNRSLSFTRFPTFGFATTYSADSFITCSSAAGTALSTGFKTNNGVLGIDPEGNKLESITYKIDRAGVPVGIISNVTLDHATPAAFYANSESRKNYYEIANQIVPSGFKFFGGGGFIEPKGESGEEEDIYQILEDGGYTVIRGLKDYRANKGVEKMILLQEEGKELDLPYTIDRTPKELTLAQVVAAAIDYLYGTKGFFIMAEGGKIDWAGHSNDALTNILETLDFAAAIEVAYRFYEKYPNETLIVVTADHETGGLSLGREKGYTMDLSLLKEQKGSMYHSEKEDKEFYKELNEKANVGWTTSSHTGIAVPVYAIGAGHRLFSGRMDNTEIPKKILELMRIEF